MPKGDSIAKSENWLERSANALRTLEVRAPWLRIALAVLALPTLLALLLGVYLLVRFSSDDPVEYADPEQHFKYGSTGGEYASGFPYWIFQALPQVCSQYLPGPGYASLGFIYEPGQKLPIGMSKRDYQGIDRTFLNCAVCHTSTVRDSPGAQPRIYTAMPANTFNVMGFQKFLFGCAKDAKFSQDYIIPEARRLAQAAGDDLDLLDRYLVYPVAIGLMRERLLMLAGRFQWLDRQATWGPGRVDTFNSAKVLFNFPVHDLPAREQNAPADFPAIWNQKPRQGMQLHWDGNNTLVNERNKSAAFGTGTLPPTIDLHAIGRVEDWLWQLPPPKYPYAIDAGKAAAGQGIYSALCAGCHGAGSNDFVNGDVGKVTPIDAIGTDPHRLDSYTEALAANQGTLYAGYPWRFTHFRKTFGYANAPLDGVWLRAPYLHNGSVPTLRDLLEPAAARPARFYRGDDVYDPVKVGFRSNLASEGARTYFAYDTSVPGNGNAGHEGERYGTQLAPSDKDALVEFLKTF